MPRVPKATSGTAAARTAPYPTSKPTTAAEANKENANPISAKEDNSPAPARREFSSYRDIPLEVIEGEVPTLIPGSKKVFNVTSMANEMRLLKEAWDGPPIKSANPLAGGPSARALTVFKGKTGKMAGADSECYYWGNVLLEKLRIWNGQKKTKAQLNAEEEFPTGRSRINIYNTMWIVGKNSSGPSISSLSNLERLPYGRF
ncbi:MAG: hypothetical protein M1829_004696 [Trizodia sp. TS-e1964]|nr:MAG: hypothetical protein M1829_004696 [Trizodia sp. TS-e1964]